MAASTSQADDAESKDSLIYIMPQRIQKSMLLDIYNGVKKANLRTSETFGDSVSHIVTQYPEQEQVLRQLKRDGLTISDDASLDRVKIVSLPWLSACIKAGKTVAVESKHLVKGQRHEPTPQPVQGRSQPPEIPLWACQRVTPLNHLNEKLTDALEVLEKHAQFRQESSDDSRALAFHRASCLLKSLPFKVERLEQVKGLKDIGGHALKVIKSILEDGVCAEVESVQNDWFRLMKEFTNVFGVGPATAKQWINNGWQSVQQARQSGNVTKDKRVLWGLAFHEDLTTPVSVREADYFVKTVKREADNLVPGVIVTLTGGFRRGKSWGHDVDILLSHPVEGKEEGLLKKLLLALQKKDLVLMGRLETSTFTPGCLQTDSKLVAMRGQLDHFEKWLGICKFEAASNDGASDSAKGVSVTDNDHSVTLVKVKHDGAVGITSAGKEATTDPSKVGSDLSCGRIGISSSLKQRSRHQKVASSTCDKETKAGHKSNGWCADCEDSGPTGETGDETAVECPPKRHKTDSDTLSPAQLAACHRSWKARRVDLIVAPYSQYYYALVGWTGNRHFNRDLRLYAQRQLRMKLTSHGLWDFAKGESVPASSEEGVFNNLKLVYKQPSDRNC